MIRPFTLLAAMLMTSQANALVIAPQCAWDAVNQRIGDADAKGEVVFPFTVDGPFVMWDYGNSSDSTRTIVDGVVVQNCQNQNYLIVSYPANNAQAEQAADRMQDMLYGDAGYTLRQMGEGVAAFGAGARVGNGDIGTCGCAANGF